MFDKTSDGGYDVAQVDKYVAEMEQKVYNLSTSQTQIDDLKSQLEIAKLSLQKYKQNNDAYAKTVMNAVNKSEEIEQLTLAKYQLELKQLRAFHTKWLAYYDQIITIYPVDSVLKKAEEFNTRMNTVLDINKTKSTVENVDNSTTSIDKTTDVAFRTIEDTLRPTDAISKSTNDINMLKEKINDLNNLKEKILEQNKSNPSAQNSSKPVSNINTLDYKEALVPKQSLTDILKDLGIDKKDKM